MDLYDSYVKENFVLDLGNIYLMCEGFLNNGKRLENSCLYRIIMDKIAIKRLG